MGEPLADRLERLSFYLAEEIGDKEGAALVKEAIEELKVAKKRARVRALGPYYKEPRDE